MVKCRRETRLTFADPEGCACGIGECAKVGDVRGPAKPFGTFGQLDRFAGMPIVADPHVPPDRIELRGAGSTLLGTITAAPTHYRQGTGQLGGGRMNKTETRWSEQLELARAAGEVRWWKNHALSLRLADRTWYRPDFLVELRGGHLSIDEVKGHWEDAARVKFKVAAELYPMFLFRAIRRDGRSSRLRIVETFNA